MCVIIVMTISYSSEIVFESSYDYSLIIEAVNNEYVAVKARPSKVTYGHAVNS